MNQKIEISDKLLKELEKREKAPEESIENVIWDLIEQVNTNSKKEIPRIYSKKKFSGVLSNKTLKDVFG